jgi:hypothetical protein
MGGPRRYPAPHPVTRSPKPEAIIAGSVNEATVVGISEKNAPVRQLYPRRDGAGLPAEIPETTTNMINGAKDILTGHKTNKAKPLLIIARIKAFTGPM